MTKQTVKEAAKANMVRGLFWFRNDLRLHDQIAINILCDSVDEVTFVYIIDDKNDASTPFGFKRTGNHRSQFIIESLLDLKLRLNDAGQDLLVLKGDTVTCLTTLLSSNHYTHVAVNKHAGYDELAEVNAVKSVFPTITYIEKDAVTLFNEEDFPFSIEDMPDVFSPFRRKVEKFLEPQRTIETYTKLKPGFTPNVPDELIVELEGGQPQPKENGFVGGETSALAHLDKYLFTWRSAATYKETRNALDTWRHSTKLSPWLAHGNISPRAVMQQVYKFEETVEKNDSTYWIYFELLWREFFHWLQRKYGAKWFQFDGIHQKVPHTHYDESTFTKWCKGETGYSIVDACMRQLRETGYMSNRGRQLVASCFVHELGQDWRYGAAWFEHQLVDYDVGSNWGNWLYLAGVGSDPRGHRQFNLQKQTDTYDPKGKFQDKWL